MIKQKLAALLTVKTVVTFAVTAVFCVLAVNGKIAPETVTGVVSTVLAFYFGTQHEKSNKNDNENEDK